MHFVPQALSMYSNDPLDDIILCSSIPSSTLVLNEDQSIDGVGVSQPTCTVIYEEYDWQIEHQYSEKDESFLSKPPPFFLDIFGELYIHGYTYC